MFEYMFDEQKKIIRVVKEGKVVGELAYSEDKDVVCIDMFKVPLEEGNNRFDECFSLLNTMSKDLAEIFGVEDEKKIVWGTFPEIKDYDLQLQTLNGELSNKTVKSKGKK